MLITTHHSLLNNEIYSLLLDQTGTIWISSYHGLNRVRKSQTSDIRFESFIHQPDNISSISENHIVSLLEDDSGIIWAGTHGKGLNLYDRNAEKFRHYLNHPASEIRLNDNNIKSIFDDPDENILWIGTHNGGLNRVNLETNSTQYFTNQSVRCSKYRPQPHN